MPIIAAQEVPALAPLGPPGGPGPSPLHVNVDDIDVDINILKVCYPPPGPDYCARCFDISLFDMSSVGPLGYSMCQIGNYHL